MSLPKYFAALFRRITTSPARRRKNKADSHAPRRSPLGFEPLEDRVAPVVDAFTWEMTPRIVADSYGRFEIPNTKEFVGADDFEFTINLRETRIGANLINPTSFMVHFQNALQQPVTPVDWSSPQPEVFKGRLPEGSYEVSVTPSINGNAMAPFSQQMTIDDILVVAMGDSYASGEGAAETLTPVMNVVLKLDLANHGTNVIRIGNEKVSAQGSTNPLISATNLVQAMKSSNIPEFKNLRYEIHGERVLLEGIPSSSYFDAVTEPYGQPIPWETTRVALWASAGDSLELSAENREHRVAHRSSYAASAQSALYLEQSNPHTSVTFVFVAQSGATIDVGALHGYEGIDYELLYGDKMLPQVEEISRLVDGRPIDFLTMSFGGNDIGFSSILTALVLKSNQGVDPNLPVLSDSDFSRDLVDAIREGDESKWDLVKAYLPPLAFKSPENTVGLNNLTDAYDRLNIEIRNQLQVQQIFITEYPNPFIQAIDTLGAKTVSENTLNDITPAFLPRKVEASEARWAIANVQRGLNEKVKQAAQSHGWTYVSGIDEAFAGHGYSASDNTWFKTATTSATEQGPAATPLFGRSKTAGTVHPNHAGQTEIATRLIQFLTVGGLTGDVIKINLEALNPPPPSYDEISLGQSFAFTGAIAVSALGDETPLVLQAIDLPGVPQASKDIVLRDASGKIYGRILLPDRIEPKSGTLFRESGEFYFVPGTESDLPGTELRLTGDEDNSAGFQGIIRLNYTISSFDNSLNDPTLQSQSASVQLRIAPGYSSWGQGRVDSGATRLDILQLQQRLRYFGFTGADGKPLVTDGLMGPNTRHAIGEFNNRVSGSTLPSVPSERLNRLAQGFINNYSTTTGPFPLGKAAQQGITETFAAIKTRLAELGTREGFGAPVAGLGITPQEDPDNLQLNDATKRAAFTLGGRAPIDELFETYLLDPVKLYFDTAVSPTMTGFVHSLPTGVMSNRDIVEYVQTSESTVDGETRLATTLRVTRPVMTELNVDGAASQKGLALTESVPVEVMVTTEVPVVFGFKHDLSLSDDEAFFVKFGTVRSDITQQTVSIGDFNAKLGILGAKVGGGTIVISAATQAVFPNRDVSLAELRTQPLSAVAPIVSALTGTTQIDLPLEAKLTPGGIDFANAAHVVIDAISGGSSTVHFNAAETLRQQFTSLTLVDLQAAFARIGDFFSNLSSSPALDANIPFLKGLHFGDLADLGAGIREKLLPLLNTDEGALTFGTIQELLNLSGLRDFLRGAGIEFANGDLLFHFSIKSDSDALTAPVGFNGNLGQLAGISTSSTGSVRARADVSFTLGIKLTSPEVTDATPLVLLNDSRGILFSSTSSELRIVSRSGQTYNVQLDGATTIQGLLAAIQTGTDNKVTAAFDEYDRLVITDTSTPAPVTESTSLTNLNGGLGVPVLVGVPEIEITVRGNDTTYRIDLNDAATIQQVLDAIETGTSNLVTASLNGQQQIVLTDTSTGGGTFSVTRPPRASTALSALGLSGQPTDGVLTGSQLSFLFAIMDPDPENDPNTALELGIQGVGRKTDNHPDPVTIEGTPLRILGLADRLFLEPGARLTASVDILDDNFDATARLGLVGVGITNGRLSATAGVELALQDISPADGRISLRELSDRLDNPSELFGPITVPVSANLDLPISLEPAALNLAFTDTNSDGQVRPRFTLTFRTPDALGSQEPLAQTTTEDMQLLEGISHLTFDDLINAFRKVVEYLSSVEGLTFLSKHIEGLGINVSQLVSIRQKFSEFVDLLARQPSTTLQDFAAALRTALGLAANDPTVRIETDGTALKVVFRQMYNTTKAGAIQLDLKSLASGGIGNLVDAQGRGTFNAAGGATLDFALGVDFSNPSRPRPFLYDSTDLALTASASANNLNFSAALGPLGLAIHGGALVFDTDGLGGTASAASFTISLADTNGDHRLYFDEGVFEHASIEATGGIGVSLPTFVVDRVTNNESFIGSIAFSVPNLANFLNGASGAYSVSIPNFQSLVDGIDLSAQMDALVDGFTGIFQNLEKSLDTLAFAGKLPLIGDQLTTAMDFIERIRDEVISKLTSAGAKTITFVQEKLFEALGPGELNWLKDVTGDEMVTPADVVISPSNPTLSTETIIIDMQLGQSLTVRAGGQPTKFDIGLPALGLSAEGNIDLKLGFDMGVRIGISKSDGIFFDTTAYAKNAQGQPLAMIDGQNAELVISAQASIPGAALMGQLGFLRAEVRDDPSQPSLVSATFTVDIRDKNSDNHLTLGELGSLAEIFITRLNATADVNLVLKAGFDESFSSDSLFPTISTKLRLVWNFANTDPSKTGAAFGGTPQVSFSSASFDPGKFIKEYLGNVLKEINKVLDPIRPVLDVLDIAVPILSDLGIRVTMLDIAEAFGVVGPGTRKFLTVVKKLLDLEEQISTFASQGGDPMSINFGDAFVVGDVRTAPSLKSMAAQLANSPISPKALLSIHQQNIIDQMTSLEGGDPEGFQIPILTNPSTIFGLLFGKRVDLFTFTTPQLRLEAKYEAPPIPVFPPFLTILLGGRIGMAAQFSFGFDTRGLERYFVTHNLGDAFKGFHFRDLNSQGTDLTEVRLYGGLYAKAAAGFAYDFGDAHVKILLGVLGGIFAKADFNLHDPDRDGKVYFDEMADSIASYGFSGMFDSSGGLYAGLDAFITIQLAIKLGFTTLDITIIDAELELLRIKLLDFAGGRSETDENASPPSLADFVPEGSFQSLHIAATEGDDTVRVTMVGGDVVVAVGGRTKEIPLSDFSDPDNPRSLVFDGRGGNDTITIDQSVPLSVTLIGGAGSDRLVYQPSKKAVMDGGDGDDYLAGGGGGDELHGGSGVNTIEGHSGIDYIFGGPQRDIIRGGFDRDVIDAGDGNNDIDGGDGDDDIIAGAGNDEIHGGRNDDTIHGGGGTDSLIGDEGGDHVYGDAGDDEILGGGGNDYLYGGADNDVIHGDGGTDEIFGEGGSDHLYGNGDPDMIDGGADDDFLYASNDENGTGDIPTTPTTLIGGPGDDMIYGDAGPDNVTGGDGNDTIMTHAGNDTIDAGAGADTVYAGAGADTVIGGADDDVIYAGLTTLTGDDIAEVNTIYGDQGIANSEGAADRIYGDKGRDVIYGGGGNDIITGSAGDDVIAGEMGYDTLQGGTGRDVLWGGVAVVTAAAFPTDLGSEFFVSPPNASERVADQAGFVTPRIMPNLLGGGVQGVADDGRDTISGDADTDWIFGGSDIDELRGGTGDDYVDGGSGDDFVSGGANNDVIRGGDDDDILRGDGGIDQLYGDAGDDQLFGDGGSNGSQAGQRLFGGSGYDTLYASASLETNSTANGTITVTAGSSAVTGLGTYFLADLAVDSPLYHLDGTTVLGVVASITDNTHLTLTANVATGQTNIGFKVPERNRVGDELHGGADGDYLYGNQRRDILFGDGENDYLHGDYLVGPGYARSTDAGRDGGDDLLYGGAGQDQIFGGGGSDILWGGRDGDWLEGMDGHDSLFGGRGIDLLLADVDSRYVVQAAGDILDGDLDDIDPSANDALDIYLVQGDQTYNGGASVDNDTISIDEVTVDGIGQLQLNYTNQAPRVINWRNTPASMPLVDQVQVHGLMGDDSISISLSATTVAQFAASQTWVTVLEGGPGNDTILGTDGRDRINGSSGSDTLKGRGGDDRLWGDVGNGDADSDTDLLFGGLGNDDLIGGVGANFLFAWSQSPYSNWPTATPTSSPPLGSFVQPLEDTGVDRILGSSSKERGDSLYGGTGIAFMYGNGGPDQLFDKSGKPIGSRADADDAGSNSRLKAVAIRPVPAVSAVKLTPTIRVTVAGVQHAIDVDLPASETSDNATTEDLARDLNKWLMDEANRLRTLADVTADAQVRKNSLAAAGAVELIEFQAVNGLLVLAARSSTVDGLILVHGRSTGFERENQPESLAGVSAIRESDWKTYARTSNAVWYISASDTADEITVGYENNPDNPLLFGRHTVKVLTGGVGSTWVAGFDTFKDGTRQTNPSDTYFPAGTVEGGARPADIEAEMEAFARFGFVGLDEKTLAQRLFGGEPDFQVIVVDAFDGDDVITVEPTVRKSVWVDAGKGNDTVINRPFINGGPDLTDQSGQRNDSANQAANLGVIAQNASFTGFTIDSNNKQRPDHDYYRFSLGNDAAPGDELRVIPEQYLQNLRMRTEIFNASGGSVVKAVDAPLQIGSLNKNTEYYLLVDTWDDALPSQGSPSGIPVGYRIEFAVAGGADAAEPAETLAASTPYALNNLAGLRGITGLTVQPMNADTFSFSLYDTGTASTSVTLETQTVGAAVTVELLNADGTATGASASTTGNPILSLNGLAKGNYQLRVTTTSTFGARYCLTPNVATISPSGNGSFTAAYQLPALNYVRPVTAQLTTSQKEAWFTFSLARTGVAQEHFALRSIAGIGDASTSVTPLNFGLYDREKVLRHYVSDTESYLDLEGLLVGEYWLRVWSDTDSDLPLAFQLTSATSPAYLTTLDLAFASDPRSFAVKATLRRDVVLGGPGNDTLQGGSGEDWLFGDDGNDVLTGGRDSQAEDLLFGGNDDDLFQLIPDDLPVHAETRQAFDNGNADRFDGGDGTDRAVFVGLDSNAEVGSGKDFVVIGFDRFLHRHKLASLVTNTTTTPDQFINTEDGVMARYAFFQAANLEGTLVDTRGGADIVHLDTGFQLRGETWGIARGDVQGRAIAFSRIEVHAGPGGDIVIGGTSDEIIDGGSGRDFLAGGEGNDRIFGDDGNDFIFGGALGAILGGDGQTAISNIRAGTLDGTPPPLLPAADRREGNYATYSLAVPATDATMFKGISLPTSGESTSVSNSFAFEGTSANHRLGMVTPVGDFNGDGFDDFIVGSATPTPGNWDSYLLFGPVSPDSLYRVDTQVQSSVLELVVVGDSWSYRPSLAEDENSEQEQDRLASTLRISGQSQLRIEGAPASHLGAFARSMGNIVGNLPRTPTDGSDPARDDLVFIRPATTPTAGAEVRIVAGTAITISNHLGTNSAIRSITIAGTEWNQTDLQVLVFDYTGDGRDDLFVMRPSFTVTGTQTIGYLFDGSDINSSTTLTQDNAILKLHSTLNAGQSQIISTLHAAVAGDINRDGREDLLIGDSTFLPDGGSGVKGIVYFIAGQASISPTQQLGAFADFVWLDYGLGPVTTVGDVNRDGYDDIALLRTFEDPAGRNADHSVMIIGGTSKFVVRSTPQSPVEPGSMNDASQPDKVNQFLATLDRVVAMSDVIANGTLQVQAGDFDGNGTNDLAVSTAGVTVKMGSSTSTPAYADRVFIVSNVGNVTLGAAETTSQITSSASLMAESSGDLFGVLPKAPNIDLNADRVADVLVGAPAATVQTGRSSPDANAGRVFVVYGGRTDYQVASAADIVNRTVPGSDDFLVEQPNGQPHETVGSLSPIGPRIEFNTPPTQFEVKSGDWQVESTAHKWKGTATAAAPAISLVAKLNSETALNSDYRVEVRMIGSSLTQSSTIVFDYVSDTDYKYAGWRLTDAQTETGVWEIASWNGISAPPSLMTSARMRTRGPFTSTPTSETHGYSSRN